MAEPLLAAFFAGRNIKTMETHGQTLPQNRFAVLLAQPWASRLLATLGILIMTVGLYVPCAGRDVIFLGDGPHAETWTIVTSIHALPAPLQLGRMPLPMSLGFYALVSVLTLGGLALIPLLWRPLSPKGTALLRWTYADWLALLTILAVAGLAAQWQPIPQEHIRPSPDITFGAPYLLPGAAVFPLGVLVSCAAFALMFRAPLPASIPTPAPRTGWQWTASLVLTAGLLVWGIGFYVMPEAVTGACPPVIFAVTHFAHGACAGIDSDEVLTAARGAGLNPIAQWLFTLAWNFEFLVAAGCITALGGWTRRLGVQTLAWLAAWPLLALGAALVALHGVDIVARHGFQLTFATRDAGWHMASGMVVTFAGLALVMLGQLGLWRELLRRKATTNPPATTEP